MVFSPLISGTLPHHNKYHSRGDTKISRMIVHHWAGTSGGDVSLASPDRDASANYIIYSDGRIVGQVPEEYRAWTSGSPTADNPSITVEVQNSTGAPDWEVSDAAIKALTALTADVAKRYGWGRVTHDRVRGHQEFYATACPGPYLYPRLGDIADAANTQPAPTPALGQEEDDDMTKPLYVQDRATNGQGSIYRVLANGKKRLIPTPEWNGVRAQEAASAAAGYPDPVIIGQISASDLAKIPDA